jgi:hypothetical protein
MSQPQPEPQPQVGAVITGGAQDWQIFQRDATGVAAIALQGTWHLPPLALPGCPPTQRAGVSKPAGGRAAWPRVQARLVHSDTGQVPARSCEWSDAALGAGQSWQLTLRGVPSGGLYRIETRCAPPGQNPTIWSTRGDMRHFLGVGDLWVIAGQSNAAGYGRGPIYDPPQLGVHVLRNSQQWTLAAHPLNDSTNTRHPVNREGANPGHSPWLHFGRLLQSELGYPIGLVQTSLGGSALAPWNPTETSAAGLFTNMCHCIELAGGRVAGVLWYQGESDTGSAAQAESYAQRFGKAVGAWRRALKNRDLPVLTVQLNRMHGIAAAEPDRLWSLLREQQRQAAAALHRVVVVPSLDLALGDQIHIGSEANMLLAQRSARAALGAFYGRDELWQAPTITGARRKGKSSIELSFDHVEGFLSTINSAARPFVVEDEGGSVAVESWSGSGAVVTLKLARLLQGAAQVHGCPGIDPPMAPHDEPRLMPMLAFYGVKVE